MSVLPYASVAEFKAYPHDLALASLIPGGNAATQDATIGQQLSRATADAINYLNRDYAAATVTRTVTARVRGVGEIRLPIPEGRCVSVTSATVKASLTATPIALDVSTAVLEDDGRVAVLDASNWAGMSVRLTVTYVAGYGHTVLTAAPIATATQVAVASGLAFRAGDVVYLDDPTYPERVTVASTYVPGSLTVPLVAPLAYAKVLGAAATALPDDFRHAVILWTAGLLARPSKGGAAGGEPFAGAAAAPGAPHARPERNRGDTYITQAQSILASARRVL